MSITQSAARGAIFFRYWTHSFLHSRPCLSLHLQHNYYLFIFFLSRSVTSQYQKGFLTQKQRETQLTIYAHFYLFPERIFSSFDKADQNYIPSNETKRNQSIELWHCKVYKKKNMIKLLDLR